MPWSCGDKTSFELSLTFDSTPLYEKECVFLLNAYEKMLQPIWQKGIDLMLIIFVGSSNIENLTDVAMVLS